MGDDIKVEMGFSVVWDLKINSVTRKSHKEKKGKELLDVRLGFEIFISFYIHIHMKHSKNNLGPFSVTSSIYLTHKTQHLKFHLMDFHWFCTIKTCSFNHQAFFTLFFLHFALSLTLFKTFCEFNALWFKESSLHISTDSQLQTFSKIQFSTMHRSMCEFFKQL